MKGDLLNFADMCKRLKPFLGQKIDNLYLESELADTMEQKREIYQVVLALYYKYVEDQLLDDNIILEIPKDGLVDAEYELGVIRYPNHPDQKFGLRDKDWTRHVCISGMSGSGKTTFAMRIIKNFLDKKKPFWVFDWKKSFRQLLELSQDVIIFTVGKTKVSNYFRFNINKPPKGVSVDEWIVIMVDILCEVFGASFGVHKLLTEVLGKAYREFGCYAGSENYPTWFQIRDRLRELEEDPKYRGRKAEWITSAARIAHSLTFGEFGQTINDKSKYNISIEEMFEKQVVFELDALGTMEKKFFCSFLLLYTYKYKKAISSELNNSFSNAILVDEAHNIFLKENPNFTQETVTDTIYREIREYGISLICLDQHVSKLSETVLGNSSTNIAFQQVLPQDVDVISKLMFLNEERSIFTQLHVGQSIVKMTDRFYKPFTMFVEQLNISKKIISDIELKKIVKKTISHNKRLKVCADMMDEGNLATQVTKAGMVPGVKVEEIQNEINGALKAQEEKEDQVGLRNHLQDNIEKQIVDKLRENKSLKEIKMAFGQENYQQADINHAIKHWQKSKEGKKITKFIQMMDSLIKKITRMKTASYSNYLTADTIGHLEFLQYLQQSQGTTTTQTYKDLKMSIRKGNAIKNSLVEMGLAYIHEDRNGKGLRKKIKLTDSGLNFMERLSNT